MQVNVQPITRRDWKQIHNKWMIKYHEMCAPECHVGRTGKCVNALHKMLGSGMFILSL